MVLSCMYVCMYVWLGLETWKKDSRAHVSMMDGHHNVVHDSQSFSNTHSLNLPTSLAPKHFILLYSTLLPIPDNKTRKRLQLYSSINGLKIGKSTHLTSNPRHHVVGFQSASFRQGHRGSRMPCSAQSIVNTTPIPHPSHDYTQHSEPGW